MSEKLKPCPFCGGKGKVWTGQFGHYFYGECENCGVETAKYDTKAEAIIAWNTRAEQPRKCKDCKHWRKTSYIVDDPNPSGKCSRPPYGKHDGYGIHANQSCCDFEGDKT